MKLFFFIIILSFSKISLADFFEKWNSVTTEEQIQIIEINASHENAVTYDNNATSSK